MSRDARQDARHYYAAQGRCLADDLVALAANHRAVIVWHPQLVALMKPVSLDCPGEWLELESSPPRSDSWYVHLLVGSLPLASQLGGALEPLEHLCFQRGRRGPRLHRLSWTRFISRGTPPHHPNPPSIENTLNMGFMQPEAPAAPPAAPPPTVTITETSEADTQNQYDALSAKRKGLISTIQAGQQQNSAPSTTGGGGAKLG